MKMEWNSYCTIREENEKVLLFNSRNLEMVLISSEKFHKNLSEEDICELTRLGFIGKEESLYSLDEVYPDHISKAYLLFGTDCNIACQYCTVKYNAQNYTYKGIMSEDTLENSLRFLFKENKELEHITLYGGEPLLHKELLKKFFKYLENLSATKIPRIDLITNGIIIDTEILRELKRWDVLVLVSLDGMECHHDTFRTDSLGNGTYKFVLDGINAYRSAGIRVGISMVLGKHNYKDVRNICIELKQKYNIVSIGLTLPHMKPDVALDEEFNSFLKEHYNEILEVCQEQGLWFEQGMKRLWSLAEKKKYVYGCPSTSKGAMVRILPEGEITLCENMGLRGIYHLGNVNDPALPIGTMREREAFVRWYRRCTNNYEKCKACEAYAICGMGCPYDAYLQSGSIETVEDRSCFISRQAIEWYLHRVVSRGKILNEERIVPLDIKERKRLLVECPWKEK